jgi:phosphonate C-P lyase system protein PhnH
MSGIITPTQVALSPGFLEPVLDAQAAFRATLDALSRPGRIEVLTLRLNPPAGVDAATAAACLTLLDGDTPVWLAPHAAANRAAAWIAFHTGAPVVSAAADAAFAVVLDAASLPALDGFDWGTDEEPQRGATLIVQVPALAGQSQMDLFPSPREGGEKVPSASEADEGLPRATTNTVVAETPRSPSSALRAPYPRLRGEKEDTGDPRAMALGQGGWTLRGPGIATRAALRVDGLPDSFLAARRAMNGAFPRGLDILFTSGARLAALPRTTILEA